MHRLDRPIEGVQVPKPPRKIKDVGSLAKRMYNDALAPEQRRWLAKQLGVSVQSLESLRVGMGWDFNGTVYSSFPSRGADETIIGITRRYADGSKKTLAGTSNSGIFAPESWWKYEGPICIVEGASDVAALITHGFAALGRPSNVGGAGVIREYLHRRAKGRAVLVIGEQDFKPAKHGTWPCKGATCIGCAWCFPGLYGAIEVARKLHCESGMVPESWKDVRAWANGVEDFRAEFIEWLKRQGFNMEPTK